MIRKFVFAVNIIAIALAFSQAAFAELHPQCNSKGRWGYADDHGHIVVDYQYNGASEFNDGLAHVLSGKKYGVIDENGKYIIKPEYDIISPFNQFGVAQVTKGNKSGFIDRSGKIVIPVKYSYVGDFNNDGIVWVNEGGKIKKGESKLSGGQYSLLRSDGSNLLDDSFGAIGYFVPYTYSYRQAQIDKMHVTERRLTEGEPFSYWTRVQYSFIPGRPIYIPERGLWASEGEDGYYNGVYKKNGEAIIPSGRYYIASYPNDGIAIVLNAENSYNFLDVNTGSLALHEPIEQSWAFKDGYAIGKSRGLRYIYDKKGRQCSEGYTYIYPANNGVHVVRNGSDKYGLISKSGDVILAPNNYSVYPFIGGASLVKTASKAKAGYMGADGEWLIKPVFDNGYSLDNGRAIVSLGGKWGCVDKNEKVLIPFEFYSIMPKGDRAGRHYWVKREKDSKYELFDTGAGKTVIGPEYADVTPFDQISRGLAKVNPARTKSTWGIIDLSGKIIIPFEYTDALATRAAREYDDSGRGEWTPYRNMMFRLRHDSHPVSLYATAAEDAWDF